MLTPFDPSPWSLAAAEPDAIAEELAKDPQSLAAAKPDAVAEELAIGPAADPSLAAAALLGKEEGVVLRRCKPELVGIDRDCKPELDGIYGIDGDGDGDANPFPMVLAAMFASRFLSPYAEARCCKPDCEVILGESPSESDSPQRIQ